MALGARLIAGWCEGSGMGVGLGCGDFAVVLDGIDPAATG